MNSNFRGLENKESVDMSNYRKYPNFENMIEKWKDVLK